MSSTRQHHEESELLAVVKRARTAARILAAASSSAKNSALANIAKRLRDARAAVVAANEEDVEEAEKEASEKEVRDGKADTSFRALLKRLRLPEKKVSALLTGLSEVEASDDPVGLVTRAVALDDRAGQDPLDLYRITCPIGVLCVIFEARPDAAVQIASLAIKSGNALLLKGGREARRTNAALVELIREALGDAGLPRDCVQLVETREQVAELLGYHEHIDLVIPRGGNRLVRYIKSNTQIPVLGHADGICHVFLDASADATKAERVVVDAKTSYPAACNSMDCLLVHRNCAARLVPRVVSALIAAGVRVAGDAEALGLLSGTGGEGRQGGGNDKGEDNGDFDYAHARRSGMLVPGDEDSGDFSKEWLSLACSVKIVSSISEAIAFANEHGSHHTDAIVTESGASARAFCAGVDSAGVFVNASTRFADGFRYGFGAEVGVSTNRVHARGPVGVEGLLIYKYLLLGSGQRSADYGTGAGCVPFSHNEITGVDRFPSRELMWRSWTGGKEGEGTSAQRDGSGGSAFARALWSLQHDPGLRRGLALIASAVAVGVGVGMAINRRRR